MMTRPQCDECSRVEQERSQDGQTVADSGLQALLMERAERLHNYVQRRMPADVQRVIASEDILQEVWVSVFRGISGFTPDRHDAFDRWLTRITERKLLDAIRDTRRLKRGGGHRIEREARRRTTSYLDLFGRVTSEQ